MSLDTNSVLILSQKCCAQVCTGYRTEGPGGRARVDVDGLAWGLVLPRLYLLCLPLSGWQVGGTSECEMSGLRGH